MTTKRPDIYDVVAPELRRHTAAAFQKTQATAPPLTITPAELAERLWRYVLAHESLVKDVLEEADLWRRRHEPKASPPPTDGPFKDPASHAAVSSDEVLLSPDQRARIELDAGRLLQESREGFTPSPAKSQS